jgi:hypothetical protein
MVHDRDAAFFPQVDAALGSMEVRAGSPGFALGLVGVPDPGSLPPIVFPIRSATSSIVLS